MRPSSDRGTVRCPSPTMMLPVCSGATSRDLYPMWSARETHTKHVPVRNTRLSDLRLFRSPSLIAQVVCYNSCCRNRVVCVSLRVKKQRSYAHLKPLARVLPVLEEQRQFCPILPWSFLPLSTVWVVIFFFIEMLNIQRRSTR